MSVIQAQTSAKELRYVRCDDEGRLTTNLEATIDDVLMKGETAGGVKTPVLVQTDGKLESMCFGKTGAGADKELLVEANGAFVLGGGSVSALGNTNFDGTGDSKFLLTDAAGHLQVDIVSGGGGGTQYAVATTGMATGTGTLMIGSASGSAKEVNVSSAGSINTKATELQNEGTTGNANPAAGTSMAPGTFSLVVDISNMREGSILYNDASTASFDGLEIEVSADGATFYRLDSLFPFTSGSVRTAFRSVSLHGLTHLRLKNISSTDTYTSVSGTVVGCP